MADKDTKETVETEPVRTAFYKAQEVNLAGHFGKVVDVDGEQVIVEKTDGRQVRVTVQPSPVLVSPKEAVKTVLPEATQKALEAAGYKTPTQIAKATDDELKAVPGVGPATVAQIREAFSTEGA